MPEFRQQLILLKPMRPGVSGYARLQSERGRLLAQLNARGLDVDGVQAYWYGAGGSTGGGCGAKSRLRAAGRLRTKLVREARDRARLRAPDGLPAHACARLRAGAGDGERRACFACLRGGGGWDPAAGLQANPQGAAGGPPAPARVAARV